MSELAGIGQMVPEEFIQRMNEFIKTHGEDVFFACVYSGSFEKVAYAYIHPCDEMRTTENFDFIQHTFINAYV